MPIQICTQTPAFMDVNVAINPVDMAGLIERGELVEHGDLVDVPCMGLEGCRLLLKSDVPFGCFTLFDRAGKLLKLKPIPGG